MERLTDAECARLGRLPWAVDCSRVRLHRRARAGPAGLARRLVLRLSGGRAVALGNHVFLSERAGEDLAVIAHELTHCGQYQAWGSWRYFSRGAAVQLRELLHRRLGVGVSPYAYQPDPGRPFEMYGMEQQGQIVEDSFRGMPEALAISPFRPDQDAPSA